MLGVGVDLNFALVSIEELQLLLQLHQQSVVLCFLGLIQSQLKQQEEEFKLDLGLGGILIPR